MVIDRQSLVRPAIGCGIALVVAGSFGLPMTARANTPVSTPLSAGEAASGGPPSTMSADVVATGDSVSGAIMVEVPRVAFGPDLKIADGHLLAHVLLADPTVTGNASVLGADPAEGCAVPLTQGNVATLDCLLPVAAASPSTIVVTLSDGWQLTVTVS